MKVSTELKEVKNLAGSQHPENKTTHDGRSARQALKGGIEIRIVMIYVLSTRVALFRYFAHSATRVILLE